jgi:branched-chain amino acid transport system substrate-binding protein
MRRTTLKMLAMLALPSLARAQTTGSDAIEIHHVGPFTGPLAGVNSESVGGAEMYFAALNAKGGVGGRKINLVKLDDKQDSKETERLFKELIASKRILTLFMPRTTPSIYAALPVGQDAKIPMFGMQTGGIQITEPLKRYAFTLRASYQDEVGYLIRQLHSTGTRKIGFLAATDAFGKDVMAGADKTMAELGIKPVSVQPVDQRNPVVDDAVAKMLPSQPEAIILVATSKGAVDFVNLYRKQGGFAQFATLSNNGADSFIKALGANSRGMIIAQTVPSPFRQTRQVARDYATLAKSTQTPMSFGNFYGYLCARVLTEALVRTGREITPERLTQTLESMNRLDLGGMEVSFGTGKRMGANFVEASIVGQDGRLVN